MRSDTTIKRLRVLITSLFWGICLVSPFLLHANFENPQTKIEILVVDAETREPLLGVSVFTDDMSKVALSTDLDGKAMIDDSQLGHLDKINFSYIGYASVKLTVFEIRKLQGVVELFPAVDILTDTLVVIGRRDDRQEEIPYQIERIDAKTIAFSNAQTAADILENDGGVYVQKSQMGGGSPIIRGFEANRVLLVVDGVRMNNAIYRSGHLQNAVTIDPSILEQAEVIFGPGSLIYGSDDLGGVVHYRTRDPKLKFGDGPDYRLETNYSMRYASANQEKNAHLDIDYGGRRWGSLTSFSIVDYDNLRAGDNRPEDYPNLGKRLFYADRADNADQVVQSGDWNIQTPTGYTQIDFLQKLRFQPKDNWFLVTNFQYSTSTNIPRYDALSDTLGTAEELKYSEWNYGPQSRLLASAKLRLLKPTFLYNKATLITSFQKIDEDRITRRFGRSHRQWNSEDVFVYSATLDMDKELDAAGQNTLAYGGEITYNYVDSRAVQQSARTSVISLGPLTRYASDGNELMSKAAYLNYEWGNKQKTLFLNAGARYTDIAVSARYDSFDLNQVTWPDSYFEGITNRNTDLSYSLGLTWNSKNGWQFRLLGAKAFRAPNVDDLFKVRVKDPNVQLPNEQLRPEVARTGEVTLGKVFRSQNGSFVKLSATGFYTQLTDAIIRQSTGERIAVDGGIDTFDVQKNFNTTSAYILGGSGNFKLNLKGKVELSANFNYTDGESDFEVYNEDGTIRFDTLSPMDHLPPIYGRVGLAYIGERIRLEGVVRFNGRKALEDYAITGLTFDERTGTVKEIEREGADNLENAGTCREVSHGDATEIVCDGSLAWATYNFYSSYQITPKFSINLAVENILDLHYRKASSGLSAPGRNLIISIKGRF